MNAKNQWSKNKSIRINYIFIKKILTNLGLDFVTGWAARGGGRRLKFRIETQRQKIHDLARELWEQYLKEAKTKPRDVLIKLQQSASFINIAVEKILKYEKEGMFSSEFSDTIVEVIYF